MGLGVRAILSVQLLVQLLDGSQMVITDQNEAKRVMNTDWGKKPSPTLPAPLESIRSNTQQVVQTLRRIWKEIGNAPWHYGLSLDNQMKIMVLEHHLYNLHAKIGNFITFKQVNSPNIYQAKMASHLKLTVMSTLAHTRNL